jgi:hypothetical protein
MAESSQRMIGNRMAIPEVRLATWGFLLNAVWEALQSSLYRDFDRGAGYLVRTRLHCTGGDVLILLAAFWVTSLAFRTRQWALARGLPAASLFVAVGLPIRSGARFTTPRWSAPGPTPRLCRRSRVSASARTCSGRPSRRLSSGCSAAGRAVTVTAPRLALAFLAADGVAVPTAWRIDLLAVSSIATAVVLTGGGAPIVRQSRRPTTQATDTDTTPDACPLAFGRMTISTSRSRSVTKRSSRSEENRLSL